MSKTIIKILLASFLLVSLPSYSQVSIGIKAGMTANEIVFRGYKELPALQDYHVTTSIHAGLFGKIKLLDRLDLYPEILYSEKRSHYYYYDYYTRYSEVKLNYIEIPLVVSYQSLDWLALDFGGTVGFNLTDNTYYQSFNEVDAGIIGGPQFNLSEHFSIQVRYYYGLTSIGYYPLFTGAAKLEEAGSAYNQNLQVSFCYVFKPIKKQAVVN